jgi:hypothetical protein
MHCKQAFFYTNAFSTSYFILSVMDGKFKQCVSIKFCTKLGKSTTETDDMLREAFEEQPLSQTVIFEMVFTFQCQLSVS